jgi:hypothetical protein
MARRRRPTPPDECGQCGEAIPPDAYACPGCGADERTGWDANPWLDHTIDLPDGDEYEEGRSPPIFDGQVWTPRRWVLAAVIVLLGIVFLALQHSSIWLWRQD